MRTTIWIAAISLAMALPVTAQPDADACPYEACAVRVDESFLGVRLVAGEDETIVARSGLFGIVDLTEVVAVSPDALPYARTYERSRLQSALAGLAGAALVGVWLSGTGSDAFQTGALVGGIGLATVGLTLDLRSRRSFSRAVWEYNRSVTQGL
ncbi:MAG: hypothetical protein AAGK21_11000 [Bacteroidota bacterium]